ncbi:hypothetical protein scyTo_0023399 [Scyliorhinus torazame]|uniref:WAP domain-containing protein n=1 Tax=Scyliorhinus torazame TaxID=75743 RepID=A0A401QCC5_SCYTO|nr:hypothetical protein [Scyliorhinus torazame]
MLSNLIVFLMVLPLFKGIRQSWGDRTQSGVGDPHVQPERFLRRGCPVAQAQVGADLHPCQNDQVCGRLCWLSR